MIKATATILTLGLAASGLLYAYEIMPGYSTAVGLLWLTLLIASIKGTKR